MGGDLTERVGRLADADAIAALAFVLDVEDASAQLASQLRRPRPGDGQPYPDTTGTYTDCRRRDVSMITTRILAHAASGTGLPGNSLRKHLRGPGQRVQPTAGDPAGRKGEDPPALITG
jgi:hypothetical protein